MKSLMSSNEPNLLGKINVQVVDSAQLPHFRSHTVAGTTGSAEFDEVLSSFRFIGLAPMDGFSAVVTVENGAPAVRLPFRLQDRF
ncbi:MAG: hypothetical protein ACLT8I_23630 [Blautia faecis]